MYHRVTVYFEIKNYQKKGYGEKRLGTIDLEYSHRYDDITHYYIKQSTIFRYTRINKSDLYFML